jgi:hypothetical protein
MLKIYMLLIVLGLLGGVGYGAYYYYKDTQERIGILTQNNAKLEEATKIQEETINIMIEDRERIAEINRELQAELQTAEAYGDQLRATLQKHNLTHLANKKPGLIERKMQNATDRLWDCLADLTNPNGVQLEGRTESSNCNKDSTDGSSNSATPQASSAK